MSHSPATPKSTSSVHNVADDKPPFGSRYLTDDADVWSQNAWDHVPPPDDQADAIAAALAKQRSAPVPDDDKPKYNVNPSRHWDNFYKMNASNFFKNRKWLHNEFPELVAAAQPEAGPRVIVEIGCGAGNAVFPLLAANQNPALALHAFDYSSHAVKLVQSNPLYAAPPVGTIHAAVWDVTAPALPPGLARGTADAVILVFVLSALHPDEWARALANVHALLRRGGRVLLRDYGRHDLAQLRFRGGRLLDANLYVRGDKTRVYFFELDELALLFTGARVAPAQAVATSEAVEVEGGADDDADAPAAQPSPAPGVHPSLLGPLAVCAHPLFAIEQLGVDRRLIVNRKRQLKMYRVWMQGQFRKL